MAGTAHFRAHERRPVRLSAAVRLDRGGITREGTIVDLSLAGAGVELLEPVEPGSPLVLEVLAPTLWDPLRVRGVVAWTRAGAPRTPSRIGIAFKHVAEEPLVALYDVLTANKYE